MPSLIGFKARTDGLQAQGRSSSTKRLAQSMDLQLMCVLGHLGFIGKEKADRSAREGCEAI